MPRTTPSSRPSSTSTTRWLLEPLRTSRGKGEKPDPTDGTRLLAALRDKLADGEPRSVVVRGIACMGNCNRSCSVAFTAPDKFSYIFGEVKPRAEDAAAVLDMAQLFAQSSDGITRWRDRPRQFRGGLVARIPPFQCLESPVEP